MFFSSLMDIENGLCYKTKKEHHHDLTYSVKYPMKNCLESDNGETGRRLIERINEHSWKDINLKCV